MGWIGDWGGAWGGLRHFERGRWKSLRGPLPEAETSWAPLDKIPSSHKGGRVFPLQMVPLHE